MPLVLPKQKRKAHPDGHFLHQINLINKRNSFSVANKNVNFLSKLTPKLNIDQYNSVLNSTETCLSDNTENVSGIGDTQLNHHLKKTVKSKEWIEWLNQQHIEFIENVTHASDNNGSGSNNKINTLYIGMKKPSQKYNCNLIFDSNISKINYTIEMCCLHILMCTNLDLFEIYIDKNIYLHNFLFYLKETNNILYVSYVKIVKDLNIIIT